MNGPADEPITMPQVAGLLLGTMGALLSLLYLGLIVRVLGSPGDDNPIAFAFLVGAAASWIPGSGLLLVVGKRRWSPSWWLWLLAAVPTLAILLPFGLQFIA
jgi:hypothetical protein